MSRSTGQRHVKTQGTSKLSCYCTAAITVKIESETCLEVTIHTTHYGHRMSLAHVRLSDSDKVAIAGKLSQGVDIKHILDDVRDNIGSKYQRLHLLTRKYIKNIERAYCVTEHQRHQDDATSVYLKVEEMTKQKLNPVLLYKAQDQTPSVHHTLKNNDFAIGIQTPLQAEMLIQLSKDSVICVDSTHGTNGYNFNLITIVVIDEYGEGYPVAWCISNREDHTLSQIFYNEIKEKVGMLTPKWFMSYLADQYYSAWVATFNCSPPPQKLLCTWHVDRAWRENLKKISDNNLKITVYHNLRVLLEETDVHMFKLMLERMLLNLKSSDTTSDFADYLEKYYIDRKEEWATCFCKESFVNTTCMWKPFIEC